VAKGTTKPALRGNLVSARTVIFGSSRAVPAMEGRPDEERLYYLSLLEMVALLHALRLLPGERSHGLLHIGDGE